MDYLMGIDLGSTSLKAVIYDLDGRAVASGSQPTERHNPNPDHPDWTVWLPEQIWGGTAQAIREAVDQIGDPSQIKALAVTGMGMDGVPIDEKGDWLYPFISWHDPRTAPQHEWWLQNIGAEKAFSIGGFTTFIFSTAMRLLWMKENEPEILERTEKWLLIEDFLNFMLCGRKATDYTMASCTLLFDQKKLDWSDEILGLAGIDRRLLSDPLPSATPLGAVHAQAAKATGLAEGTPVILGGHDFLCGALPAGAFKPGVILDVTGTWEVVVTAAEKPILTPKVQKTGISVESHVARGAYAAWGGAAAGEMLEWYRKEFGDAHPALKGKEQVEGDWERLMAEAQASPSGGGGLLFLPHMSAVGCPVVDSKSRGALLGLTNRTTRGDILRAVIEGLDFQFLDIVNAMESALGITPEKFIAVGGAVRNEFWMQNKADIVGRPIEVPELEEATPLGAAILAGIGVGLYKDEEDAYDRVYKPGKIYQPNPKETVRYAEQYNIYKQLYTILKAVNHQIAEKA